MSAPQPAPPCAQQQQRPALVPEVADAEQLLEELDACGVGLIASLRNEHKHNIVEQVRPAACSAKNGRSCCYI